MSQTSRTGPPSTRPDSTGSSGGAHAFAVLPPGTVSPVMASVIVAEGASMQRQLADSRADGAEQAAEAAQEAAERARVAAIRAAEVAATAPSDPRAPAVAQQAHEAQRKALLSANDARQAAYQLQQMGRLSAFELQQPPPSGASDRAPGTGRKESPPSTPKA